MKNALVIELREKGHHVEQQRAFAVGYKGANIGTLIPDLMVDRKVIVDAKAFTAFNDAHVAQMTGYLAITGLSPSVADELQVLSPRMEARGQIEWANH